MLSRRHGSKLWLRFVGLIFLTIFAVFTLVLLIWFVLFQFNIIRIVPHDRHIPIAVSALGSLLLGSAITVYVGRLIVRPVQNIGDAFHELSKGNFDIKVSEDQKIAEIREMSKQFNAMTHDLSHMETLRTDFVANVSHEFKTPISSIEGYATLLQNHDLSVEKRDHYVEKILENTKRLAKLSGNMLLLSKLENQEMILDNKEFRLDEQIRRVILRLEDQWSPKSIEFDMDLPRQLYYGSEQLLDQVWSNLIENAVKHSPQQGVIRIGITTVQGMLAVSVADNGGGMTEEVIKHIFEKFYQGDASRNTEGNGLGLALVKRIVDICGGRVCVQSDPGHGSEFTVMLPLMP